MYRGYLMVNEVYKKRNDLPMAKKKLEFSKIKTSSIENSNTESIKEQLNFDNVSNMLCIENLNTDSIKEQLNFDNINNSLENSDIESIKEQLNFDNINNSLENSDIESIKEQLNFDNINNSLENSDIESIKEQLNFDNINNSLENSDIESIKEQLNFDNINNSLENSDIDSIKEQLNFDNINNSLENSDIESIKEQLNFDNINNSLHVENSDIELEDFSVSGSEYQPSASASDISCPTGSPFTPKIKRTLLNNNNTETINTSKKQTRKRIRNPKEWIKNKNKYSRIHGLSYTSNVTGKNVAAKKMGPSCLPKCRQKCFEKISESDREQNFFKFYSLQNNVLQWNYILNHVTKCDKKITKNVSLKSRRSCTNNYFLTNFSSNTKVKVCSKLFLNTLSISWQMVETSFSKLTSEHGNLQADNRGKHSRKVNEVTEFKKGSVKKHIESFAPIESHYLRNKTSRVFIDGDLNISKMYRLFVEECKDTENKITLRQYRDIFNTNFNIGFYIPKKDRCNECAKFESMKNEEKEIYKDKHDMHLFSKQKSREMKQQDKTKALKDNTVITTVFDFQKILNVPCEDTSIFYYKRKLCVFNFTLYELGSHQAYCFTWDETIGKRGANEVSTCLYQYIQQQAQKGAKVFNFYSDNCPGQNKNKCVFVFYAWISKILNIEIKHVFLEKGHTQNEGDSVHSVIEKTKKNKALYVPSQLYSMIRNCKVSEPHYIVQEIMNKDFLNFATFTTMVNLDKNENNVKVKWSEIKIIKTDKNHTNKLFYKYSFEAEEFYSIILYNETCEGRKRKKKYGLPNEKPSTLYKGNLKITTQKYKDLTDLSKYIPEYYRSFYENMHHTTEEAKEYEDFLDGDD